jgi:hypothetical protein
MRQADDNDGDYNTEKKAHMLLDALIWYLSMCVRPCYDGETHQRGTETTTVVPLQAGGHMTFRPGNKGLVQRLDIGIGTVVRTNKHSERSSAQNEGHDEG